MAFASGLTLADLSDYLAPSQACIMPVTEVDAPIVLTEAEIASKKASSAATEIMIDSEHGYHEISELGDIRQKLKKAEITIEDCLACSGCVTSEESVLVAMQSDEEVYRVLREEPQLVPILSLSPQSLASLAALHDLTITETFRGLRAFFKRELGFRLVFDITFARAISLAENRREFLERKSHASSSSSSTKSTPSNNLIPLSPSTSSTGPLPILSSACPGWICLAEKKHGELLPFVSNVKSGQAVMGTLVKGGEIAQRLNLKPQQIYHVSVMPCFDKKLEASRLDFSTPHDPLDSFTPPTTTGIRDVDCVLTTGEVQKMLNSRSLSLSTLAQLPNEDDISGKQEEEYLPSLLLAQGTSSGGYLFNTIQAVVGTLSKEELYNTRMLEKKFKNDDHISYTLVTSPSPIASTSFLTTTSSPSSSSSPKVIFRAAKSYGLRNLSNLTRKVASDAAVAPLPSKDSTMSKLESNRALISAKVAAAKAQRLALKNKALMAATGGVVEINYDTLPYDFVEVMACPDGCVNGGGQIMIASNDELKSNDRRKVKKRRMLGMKSKRVDHEGMPDFSERMEEDEDGDETMEEVAKRVWGGKEWVGRVEEVYWEIGDDGTGEQLIRIRKEEELDWSRIDDLIKPYLLERRNELLLEGLMNNAIEGLLKGIVGVEEKEARRKDLLRTTYRAVEGQTNGFAVEW